MLRNIRGCDWLRRCTLQLAAEFLGLRVISLFIRAKLSQLRSESSYLGLQLVHGISECAHVGCRLGRG